MIKMKKLHFLSGNALHLGGKESEGTVPCIKALRV